jgi:hypothetical protein
MSTIKGQRVSGTDVLTVEFYSATPTDTIVPGAGVIIHSTVNGLVTKVKAGAAVTADWFGVVLSSPLKAAYAVSDKMEIALLGTILMVEASAVITAGAKLQMDPATDKVATQTASNTIIGFALENAAADGDLIRMFVQASMVPTGETNTLTALGTGTNGETLVGTKVGADLKIKRLKAGTGITLTVEDNDIVISLT